VGGAGGRGRGRGGGAAGAGRRGGRWGRGGGGGGRGGGGGGGDTHVAQAGVHGRPVMAGGGAIRRARWRGAEGRWRRRRWRCGSPPPATQTTLSKAAGAGDPKQGGGGAGRPRRRRVQRGWIAFFAIANKSVGVQGLEARGTVLRATHVAHAWLPPRKLLSFCTQHRRIPGVPPQAAPALTALTTPVHVHVHVVDQRFY
jgi:hypothetical protein